MFSLFKSLKQLQKDFQDDFVPTTINESDIEIAVTGKNIPVAIVDKFSIQRMLLNESIGMNASSINLSLTLLP